MKCRRESKVAPDDEKADQRSGPRIEGLPFSLPKGAGVKLLKRLFA
jgi:hypothetical protein